MCNGRYGQRLRPDCQEHRISNSVKFGHHPCKGEGKWLEECKYGRDRRHFSLQKDIFLWSSERWNGKERNYKCEGQLGLQLWLSTGQDEMRKEQWKCREKRSDITEREMTGFNDRNV